MPNHIISAPEGDLHRLSVQRIGPDIFITTNGREFWPNASTALSNTMAKQLVEGINAVLTGADRAITPALLALEKAEQERRTKIASAPAKPTVDLSVYDDLFNN